MVENPTVLVIEDYSDTRMLLSSFLRAHGFKVIEARDGKEGFIQANRVIPDLILMDLALPKMDGIETTRRIRQRHALSQTPIFAISAYATGDVARDAVEAGCTEVFGKPFEAAHLLERIHANLRSGSIKVGKAAGAH